MIDQIIDSRFGGLKSFKIHVVFLSVYTSISQVATGLLSIGTNIVRGNSFDWIIDSMESLRMKSIKQCSVGKSVVSI